MLMPQRPKGTKVHQGWKFHTAEALRRKGLLNQFHFTTETQRYGGSERLLDWVAQGRFCKFESP